MSQPAPAPPAAEALEKSTVRELLESLQASTDGLTSSAADARLQQYGANELAEQTSNPLLKLLSYFWGPIPWMIEAAAILSAVVRDWADLTIILVLLLFNALIGFWEEYKAANALEALKGQLALKARARRDGQWRALPSRELVPGDIIRLRLGDIVPADVKLIEGDYLSIDQSALTGESLPVTRKSGEAAYSGAVVKQGEMLALVANTGADTYFGRTAKLVESAGAVSHFQRAVMRVGDFLIFVALGLSIALIGVELYRGQPAVDLIQFVLILVVASIPVAMPAVLSVTMALGALALSKRKAIVSRLQAIEEMAGIDILCSDKTGTLTQNKITLGDPAPFQAKDVEDLILAGALASKPEDNDAIDLAVIAALPGKALPERFRQLSFTPFDPVGKRTAAEVQDAQGRVFRVTKGAPQVIIAMSTLDDAERTRATQLVDDFAAKGYRTLAVARSLEREGAAWQFLGILPLFDPPRDDSAQTIAQAKAHGITVKMVTGDNVAIGREIAGKLGIGRNIQPADQLFGDTGVGTLGGQAAAQIEQADGFAQVFPEHKYGIVKALQEHGHLVGMTGDGVNDAPALKQAEVGIAVSGATDAARAAAALVLTAPGLSTIITAVEEARRIFERMMSYTIYRISMTIDIMVFVVLAMLIFDVYPLTAVMIILLALLDDIPIMTIAYDNTWLDRKPVRWDMRRVLSVSTILGFLAVIQTFGLMYIGVEIMHIDTAHLQTAIFLQLVLGGHLMLFLTRTKKAFWRGPHPSWQLFGAILATQILAVVMTGLGWLVAPLPWELIGLVWVYNLAWMVVQDMVKLGVYHLIEDRAKHKRQFLDTLNRPLHPHHAARTIRAAQRPGDLPPLPFQGLMVGAIAALAGGMAAVALTAFGFWHSAPVLMAAIAGIVIGVAYLFQGAVAMAVYPTLLARTGEDTLGATALGMSVELLAGVVGIVLGILALLEPARSMILIPAAVIVFGAVLGLSIGTTLRVNVLSIAQSDRAEATRKVVSAVAGLQVLIGVGGGALGILAVIGATPIFFTLVALFAIGASLFLDGAAVSAGMLVVSRAAKLPTRSGTAGLPSTNAKGMVG